MKKSEAYRKSIKAVMVDTSLCLDKKVDVLTVLVPDYNLALWTEAEEAKKKEEQA